MGYGHGYAVEQGHRLAALALEPVLKAYPVHERAGHGYMPR